MDSIDLNCDMGESFGVYELGDDAAMLRIVTTANVACGFHAGDPLVMHATMALARENGVAVGAHPSYLDLWGFGRRPMVGEPPDDVGKAVVYQVGAAQAVARSVGHRVTHVKTHGALGNQAAADAGLADGIARAVRAVDPELLIIVMPGSEMERAAGQAGLQVAREVYADRTYDDDGSLTSRRTPGSVLHDAGAAAERVLRLVEDGAITSVNGRRIPVRIDTVCVHGDTPDAVAMASCVRERLERAGLAIRPVVDALAAR
jgi:UPF0271 protein